MANVELNIGGHSYVLACADGEESALKKLGQMVDEQIRNARLMTGGLTEARQLLFAAILLAERATAAESKLAIADASNGRAGNSAAQLISLEELDEVSARLEQIAARLAAITA